MIKDNRRFHAAQPRLLAWSAFLSLSKYPDSARRSVPALWLAGNDILTHVDDLVIEGVDSHLQWLRSAILREFKMEGIGRPTCVLGMDIDLRSDAYGSIHLFQRSYISHHQAPAQV